MHNQLNFQRKLCWLQDIVTRYASTTGHYCPRRFGWDCHGLPVENEINKKLGEQMQIMSPAEHVTCCRSQAVLDCQEELKDIPTVLPVAGITRRDEVLKMGIKEYNDECRSIVMR